VLGDGLALAGVAPDPVGGQIHVGAVSREVLVVDGAVVEVRLGAADPTAVGEQAEPEVGPRSIAVAALGEALLPSHHRLDEGEVAAIGQMRAIPHDQRHFFSGRQTVVLSTTGNDTRRSRSDAPLVLVLVLARGSPGSPSAPTRGS